MSQMYVFSGLGADKRVFQNPSFAGKDVTHVRWLQPQSGSVQHYASRLLHQIKATNPVVVGLSFGVLVAVEIARQVPVDKLILISGAKTKDEIPYYFRLAGFFRAHRLIPASLLKVLCETGNENEFSTGHKASGYG